MHRTITGFRRDERGGWVVDLSCLHRTHVRGRPPSAGAARIDDDEVTLPGIGEALDCPRCDRTELPDGLEAVRMTPTWDAATMPPALGRDHRVAARTWGLLEVEVGVVRFAAETDPPTAVAVTPSQPQPIPPEVDHHVAPQQGARFHLVFLTRP